MTANGLIFGFELPLWANVLAFAASTCVVWIAGTRLVLYGDEMAERFNLGRAFVGLIVLATITELPEVVTSLTAAASGNAPLAIGNMFGGITMQTAILAVVDLFIVRYALTSWPRKPTHALEAVLLVLFLTTLLGIALLGERELIWGVGVGSVILCIGYPAAISMLRRFDERATWAPIDLPGTEHKAAIVTKRRNLKNLATSRLLSHVALLAALILAAGYATANRADILADQTGLGSSFVGVALLAAATSTPEMSTTFAAARIGAYTLAISNIFGSNLIMIALILPADIAYRPGPILAEVSLAEQVSLLAGIAVSMVYVTGLLMRRTPRLMGAGVDSVLVLGIYIASLFVIYRLTQAL